MTLSLLTLELRSSRGRIPQLYLVYFALPSGESSLHLHLSVLHEDGVLKSHPLQMSLQVLQMAGLASRFFFHNVPPAQLVSSHMATLCCSLKVNLLHCVLATLYILISGLFLSLIYSNNSNSSSGVGLNRHGLDMGCPVPAHVVNIFGETIEPLRG